MFNDRRTANYGDLELSNRQNSEYRQGVYPRLVVSDEDMSPAQGDNIIAFTSLTASRSVNLLPASSYKSGQSFHIVDESGLAGSNNIVINPFGSETISGAGSLVISTNYGFSRIYSNGSNWYEF